MDSNNHISVRSHDGVSAACVICGCDMHEDLIALFLRQEPGGPFDAICRDDAVTILKTAQLVYDLAGLSAFVS